MRCPYRNSTSPARESSMFFISYGARTGPGWDAQGCRTVPLRTRKGIVTARIGKNPARASYLAVRDPYGPPTVPARAVRRLFMISKPVRGPLAALMHALKLYGPRTGRQNSYGAARDPWVDVRFLFKTALEQPGDSPYGARECDVIEALDIIRILVSNRL